MKKSTQELLEVLTKSKSIQNYIDENDESFSDCTLSEYVNMMALKKNLSKSEVVRGSDLSTVYAYKIFSGERAPKRDKLLALAFGLKLDLDETQRMLKIGGAGALYPRIKRDSVIIFAIKEGLSLIDCNELLYELEEAVIE